MHEMVDLLLEYRQLSKLKSTYVDGLLELVSPTDHRVHTSFNQTIAATGRLSSSNPNLQNIPIRTEVGRRIRRAFLADPGMYLLTADYSQIELRILAHITHEPALVAAFLADEDIHAATAAQLFKVPLAEVRPEQRRLAKTVNFAVLYGQSAFGLANVTGMTNAEAVEFIRTYEKTFPKVREYVESTLLQARTQGFVQTLLGRRRYVPPDMATLPLAQRQAVEREAINMPIQGTNADMIKIAMVRLDAAHARAAARFAHDLAGPRRAGAGGGGRRGGSGWAAGRRDDDERAAARRADQGRTQAGAQLVRRAAVADLGRHALIRPPQNKGRDAMSAWGTKVWQDDAADDVLITFEDLLEAGATPREAVRLIILNPPYGWGDDLHLPRFSPWLP